MPHYTSASDEAFINRITFDFIAQLLEQLEMSRIKQCDLANKLHVNESSVSQVLNLTRMNLNLKTMVKYALASGMKLAVVAYNDCDPLNEHGPVGSEIFSKCWERLGRPRDMWSLDHAPYAANKCLYTISDWRYGWTNSTLDSSSTASELPRIPKMNLLTQEGTAANA